MDDGHLHPEDHLVRDAVDHEEVMTATEDEEVSFSPHEHLLSGEHGGLLDGVPKGTVLCGVSGREAVEFGQCGGVSCEVGEAPLQFGTQLWR